MSSVLMMTSPCIFGMALANKALDFTLLRFGIGFGLSTFVSCQFWTASMFNVKIVGKHSRLSLSNCSSMQVHYVCF